MTRWATARTWRTAIGATRNWARAVTIWNMALDTNHGPVIGSCTNCMGVVTTNGSNVT